MSGSLGLLAGGLAGGIGTAMAAQNQQKLMQMYADQLRGGGSGGGADSGWTDTTGQNGSVPPSASWWQRNMPTWLGGATPSGQSVDPSLYMPTTQVQQPPPQPGPVPGVQWNYSPAQGWAASAAPGGTGTTQGQRPIPIPPIPPGNPQGYPATPPTFGAGMPGGARPGLSSQQFAMPYPIQGFPTSGALPAWNPVNSIYQPGSTNFGTFGRIT